MRGRHEGRRLLVAGHHELDGGAPQRLNEVEVLLAGDPEDLLHALILKRGYEQFGAVHRAHSSQRPAWQRLVAGLRANAEAD
jgi:hypothetical protein